MSEMRKIKLGRPFGIVYAWKTPFEIATKRSHRCETHSDAKAFMDAFTYTRSAVTSAGPTLDVEGLFNHARSLSASEEAGMIEALAACRAEGRL